MGVNYINFTRHSCFYEKANKPLKIPKAKKVSEIPIPKAAKAFTVKANISDHFLENPSPKIAQHTEPRTKPNFFLQDNVMSNWYLYYRYRLHH